MLTSAVLSALCTFGGYSVNLSNYPRFYDNVITVHCYYDLNKGYYDGGSFEVLHFHDICKVHCDFEKQDDGIHVFINDMEVNTYLINNSTNDSETKIGGSLVANYSNNLSPNGVLLLPNDDYYRYLTLSHSDWSYSSPNASFRTYFAWFDSSVDDYAGTFANESLSVTPVVSTFRANTYHVSLDDLYRVVNSRFGSAYGGYEEGYDTGYGVGYNEGSTNGYDTGYADGYTDGVEEDLTVFTIFNGILSIGMVPINVFLAIFNFSILGINLSNFIMSLLTVFVTIWVVRMIIGGGNKSD